MYVQINHVTEIMHVIRVLTLDFICKANTCYFFLTDVHIDIHDVCEITVSCEHDTTKLRRKMAPPPLFFSAKVMKHSTGKMAILLLS